MVALNDEVRAALQSGHLAHLTTLNADGSPQVSVVWIGLEGDEIVCGHLSVHQKIRNLRRDPRVVISLVTGGVNPGGLAHYLVIAGHARVVDGGAAELLQRLARVYLGPGVKFPPMDDPLWDSSPVSRSIESVGSVLGAADVFLTCPARGSLQDAS